MSGLSLDEQHQVAQIVSHLQYLQQLDIIWTQHLRSATQIQPGDVTTLQSLANEMQSLLKQVPVDVEWVHGLIRKDPQRIDVTLNEFLDHPLLAEQKQRLMAMAQNREGFSAILDGVSAYLYKNSSVVSDQIVEKIDKISKGQFTQGDFPGPFSCALMFAISTLAVIAGAEIPPLLPVGIGGYLGFCYQDCPETLGNFFANW